MRRCVAFIQARGFYLAAMRVPEEYPGVVSIGKTVLEANVPARRKGVEDGMLLTSAYSFAPELVVVEYDRDREPDAKRLWLDPCARVASAVEPVAPHAVFLDISHAPEPTPELHDLLRTIADTFPGVIPVAGLSTNKTLALLANHRAMEEWKTISAQTSPEGREQRFFSFLLPPRHRAEFLRRLPLFDLPLDPRLLQRVARLGIYTAGDLLPMTEVEAIRRFGPDGRKLYQTIRGHDPEPVHPLYPPRKLTVRSPATEIENEQAALWMLDRVAAAASEHLARQSEWARRLTLEIETEKGMRSETKELPSPTREAASIRSACRRLFRKLSPSSTVRRFTLRIEMEPVPTMNQPDLFCDLAAEARRSLLESALRWACRRFGEKSVLRDPLSPRRERLRTFYEIPE